MVEGEDSRETREAWASQGYEELEESRFESQDGMYGSRRWWGCARWVCWWRLDARAARAADVMARVNGRKILRTEVEKYYRNQTEGQPAPSAEQAQGLRLSILREMIENEILAQRAEKLGLLATDEEVDGKLSEIRAPFTEEEFDQRLKERGITLEDFKRDLRRSITVEKVLNKEITSKIIISDSDISNYYNQHKAEFNLIVPQYHLAQILVTTQPNPQVRNLKNDKAQNEAEAKKKVSMLMNRLESGEDFATLAMNYSEQPDTSATGGDLGFIPENSLQGDKQAYDAISRLKPGQFTPPLPAATRRRTRSSATASSS